MRILIMYRMCPDRYSLQLALRYKKYHKSLFLGFFDLAIINAFIVFNRRRVADNQKKLSYVKFLKQLHLELCQLQEADWEALRQRQCLQVTPTKARARKRTPKIHKPVPNDEWCVDKKQGRKRRTRACKVCSRLKSSDTTRGGESSMYCSACKLKTTSKKPKASRVYLCDKVKRTHDGQAMSCFEIWHKAWLNGTALPQARRQLRARTPAELSEEEEKEGEGSDDEEGASDGSSSDGHRQHKRVRLAPA